MPFPEGSRFVSTARLIEVKDRLRGQASYLFNEKVNHVQKAETSQAMHESRLPTGQLSTSVACFQVSTSPISLRN